MTLEQLIVLVGLLVYMLIRWLARRLPGQAPGQQAPHGHYGAELDEEYTPTPTPPPFRSSEAEMPRTVPSPLKPPLVLPPRVPRPTPAVPVAAPSFEDLLRQRKQEIARQASRRPATAPLGASVSGRPRSSVLPRDRAELRRAIVLMTVLGSPRALDPANALAPADRPAPRKAG